MGLRLLQTGKKADSIFCYEQSRKGVCAEKALGGYTGVVISDGYSGYNILSKAVRAGCRADARRKWVEAMPEGATQENALAAKGLEYCSRLFEVEQKLEALPDAERRERRQLLSKPIVDAYYTWLDTIFKPAGRLKKAITYSLNQQDFLCAFLDHGEIEISNNQPRRTPSARLSSVGKTGFSVIPRPGPTPV